MKRVLSILLLAVFTLTLHAQSARRFYKTGEDFMEVNKFEDAIEQFTNALNVDPDYDKAYLARANAYERLEQYEKAARDYERAIVFNERDEEIHYKAGKAYFDNQEPAKALSKLNDALDRKSKFLEAYQLRSMVYLELERYDEALEDCKKALRLKENEKNLYNLGQVYERLELYEEAEEAYRKSVKKNDRVIPSHLALARLLFQRGKYDASMVSVNKVLGINDQHKEGLMLRSKIHAKQLNIPRAVDDISVALLVYPSDPDLYELRADFYQQLNQHSVAIVDYAKVLELDPDRARVYYKRARSFEQINNYQSAMNDYDKLLEMSQYDGTAQRLLAQAEERMFEINREDNKPEVSLLQPASDGNGEVEIPRDKEVIALTGIIRDESDIKTLKVNDFNVEASPAEEGYEFLASVNLRNTNKITVQVSDVYGNSETAVFNVVRTETQAPEVRVIAPYASDNNIVYLDSNEPVIYLEGKIRDESKIRSIKINDVSASYIPEDNNPTFSARVRVENKGSFVVTAEDEYGNKTETEFTINRDATNFSDNPMGKTWAIFIENSNYSSFASLEGPTKDITLMKTALNKYQVHNFIHKKDLSKDQMERFFAIELRDLIRSNRVNSILVWYAGHGKFLNETGYWIPVDAKRDDEFTYYNINALKASMQSYPDFVTHTLVITDACESGPSFYQAMRSTPEIRSCDDWEATRFKSSQVFSSAGYELAVDNSQFTRTFANTLVNNPNACIPIESIVQKVTTAVEGNNQQKPQFGKIDGLEDENGTFFFIPKDY